MTPSVGRIVHYVRERNTRQCLAALIVKVDAEDDEGVELRVFVPDGEGDDFTIHCSPKPAEAHGYWHWPERV